MKVLLLAILLFPLTGDNDHIRNYGVKVHVLVGEDEGGGSGVYVGDKLILTAYHVISVGERYYLDDDHKQELTLLRFDEENDLALLSTTEKRRHAPLGRPPKKMDVTYTVGHPMGSSQMMVKGYIVDFTKEKLLLDSTTIRGMSGGGVYNDRGYLIGMCVSAWGDKDQQFMVAISVDVIKQFLKGS